MTAPELLPQRHELLKAAGAASLAASMATEAGASSGPAPGDAIPMRPLGKTGMMVSAIGIGGHHLGQVATVGEAIQVVQEAVDAGVNFFDNCWEYYNGKSENWLGRSLEGRRDKVFLVTMVSTHGRDKNVAMTKREESLKRLKTDHLDLWQVHECVYDNDPERHFAKGGVIEALDLAKKQGKVRYVGFTGHKSPAIHLKMLSYNYPFDAVQMPLNPFDATYRSFEAKVLPELIARGIAPLGMKSLGGNGQPIHKGIVTAQEALRYAMSRPVAVSISGVDSLAVLLQNLAVARDFSPMTDDEMASLHGRCAPEAGDGHLELYKSTMKYDGDIGRFQHGINSMKEMPI